MRIRMKVQISGTRDGQDWPAPGGELDVPDAEGATLCEQGAAIPVPAVKVEKAVRKPSAREVRDWAKAEGLDVPARGGVPEELVAQYVASQEA